MHSNEDYSEELAVVGRALKESLEARIDSGVPPPNAPSTILKKGSALALRNSRAYRDNIEVQVTPTSVEVGVFEPEIAEYVFWNEHGTAKIPPRPVFGPTMDGPGEAILDDLVEKLLLKIISNF